MEVAKLKINTEYQNLGLRSVQISSCLFTQNLYNIF